MKRSRNVSLWKDLEHHKWVLEACQRMGISTYLARKWFRESYGIFNGVRYIGPRRRAEYDALAYGPEFEREEFENMWRQVIICVRRNEE